MYKIKGLKNYFYIFSGSLILSLSVVTFLAPNHIAPGGSPGLAVILNHLSGMQLGILMLIINIPLILLSIKFINKNYGLRTIFTICCTSFTIDFFREFIGFRGVIIEPILASIYGGIMVGIALGFIIKGNASAGGPAVLSKLLSQRTKFKEEHILIGLDALIVILAGITFKNIEITLLSLITVYVSSKSIDIILSGRAVFKMVHISTNNAKLLSTHILNSLNIEGTIVSAVELDNRTNKQIIMVVIESSRMVELKSLIEKYDEKSFLVINDASEILGRGK